MTRRIAVVAGNGFTRSFLSHANVGLDSASPLRWPVFTPGRDSRLLDDLPALKAYLNRVDPTRIIADFDIIIPFIESLSPAPIPDKLTADEQSAFFDLCHYLAVGYAWFQLQLDRHSLEHWEWSQWFKEQRNELSAILSWNYDLVVERVLHWHSIPYIYAGLDPEVLHGKGNRVPVLVSKPHGSCNFAPSDQVQIFAAKFDGDVGEPMTYPRQLHLTAYDGPMRTLPDKELFSIRQVADVVLPGEWNRFHGYLTWVRRTLHRFQVAAGLATELVVVGFRMADCDQPEFERAIKWAPDLDRIIVADPAPNPKMIDLLAAHGKVVLHWPDGPFGPELVLS